MLDIKLVQKAQNTLEGIVARTPLAQAPILSEEFNSKIYFKKENLQLTGSFKLRGAFNKVVNLDDKTKAKGVVAASAGNHAQGVAWTASYFNIGATIFMPEATPLTKVTGVKYYGATVVLKGANYDEAFVYAKEFASSQNQTFIHAFADDEVIAGQGTVALEILDKIPSPDICIVPIGGGGLISGIATVFRALSPKTKLIGVVASGANAMKISYEQNKPIDSKSVKTIADGIAVRDVTPCMLEYVANLVDEIIEVTDNEIANAILFLLEKHKLIVEGAGAVGVSAIMHHKIDVSGKTVVLPLSGGNIDVTMLSVIIEKGLIKSNRKMTMRVVLIDKSGSLMHFTNILKQCDANIVQIDYDRNSVNLEFGEAIITVAIETKGAKHKQKVLDMLELNGYNTTVL